MSASPCPACGVAVTPGYARCPRCHAPLPSSRLRRESVAAGGTSVVPEPDGTAWIVWAALGLVAVGAVIAAVVLLSGGKARPVAAPEDEAAAVVAPRAPVVAAPLAPEPVPVRLDPLAAIDRLERLLATERLFGKATVRGSAIELRSELCAAPRLRAIVAAEAAALRAQGLASLACVEPHGAEVFTQAL